MAHAGGIQRVNDYFEAFIPNAYPINPITKSSWNDIGVLPDIECNSQDAFKRAYHLLLEQLLQQFSDNKDPEREHIITDIKTTLELSGNT